MWTKKIKKKSNYKKNEPWKYSSDDNLAFASESSFSIKWPKRSWYAIKQIDQTKLNIIMSVFHLETDAR